jgi:hypothetical protein
VKIKIALIHALIFLSRARARALSGASSEEKSRGNSILIRDRRITGPELFRLDLFSCARARASVSSMF